MRRLRPVPIALLALLLAIGVAACGGDDDGEASGTTAETKAKTTEQPTPSELRRRLRDTTAKPVIPKPSGSPPRRLVKEDIVRGKGPAARPGDTITVHYVGVSFSTGAEFDSSWDRGQPFPVPLGQGAVIAGWDRGLVGMREGGRRVLTIPPQLGYGREGYPPSIAPNETLVFVVDAISIKPRS